MPNKTYDKLVIELERIFHIHTVCILLEWDEQVNLPSGAHNVRASQLAAMAELHHRTAKNPEIGEWLEILEKQYDALTSDQKVVLSSTLLSS